ncbi:MAG TPA: glycine dehydrogenase, partial [Spirochaetota bacterium]|nr:glycine dehydrogenase [Spirochaetota bacterium]
EFVIRVDNAKEIRNRLLDNGYALGISIDTYYPELNDCLLLGVTESVSNNDIDNLVELLQTI